jgi:hypothetical protein
VVAGETREKLRFGHRGTHWLHWIPGLRGIRMFPNAVADATLHLRARSIHSQKGFWAARRLVGSARARRPFYGGYISGFVVGAQPPLPCGHSQVIRVPCGFSRVIVNLA